MKKIIYILFFILIFFSCTNEPEYYNITGQIVVIGNEPFSHLAIKDKSNNYYSLDISDKKIELELYKLQGEIVNITYDFMYCFLDEIYIKVIKYELLNKSNIKYNEQQHVH